ncbi:MAG: IS30 family transposase [Polaromonas sp.]
MRTLASEDWARVVRYLALGLSPQQISGRLWLEKKLSISAECIYLRLYKDKAAGGSLVQHLRCQKPRRKRYASGQERRGSLKNCRRISERAKVVEKRSRIADWEGDTVIGHGHQGGAGHAGRAEVTLHPGSTTAPAHQR